MARLLSDQEEQYVIRIASQFEIGEEISSIEPYGNGHINDTYVIVMGNGVRYILQRINTDTFHNPDELMENICRVTDFLQKKIRANGGDPERETLNVIRTKTGKPYVREESGKCYRVYRFIEHATSFEQVANPQDFYESAVAFGNFQYMLSDYPAETLHETIPNFHNTRKRYADFEAAVKADVCGRVKDVEKEISFVRNRVSEMGELLDLIADGSLPLRVTHNDTKLNNIMIDDQTGRGICVIDLDTVMPGSALYDFGDSIRFGASTALEDEKDLSKVSMDLSLYDLYVKGFLEGCKGSLTECELEELPMGAKMMTLECGMRFLADHIAGDTYFKIAHEGHNLDRARTQFVLVKDMEDKWEDMKNVVRKHK